MTPGTPTAPGFQVTPFGRLIGLRSLPGLLAILAAHQGWVVAAGILVLVAVAADVLTDSVADRCGWRRGPSDVQLEGFVDFICFAWAPLQLGLTVSASVWVAALGLLFVVAGGFRLARFNVEGLRDGGYRGLPITYSGAVVPVAAASGAGLGATDLLLSLAFLTLAVAMVSARFVTPRVSL